MNEIILIFIFIVILVVLYIFKTNPSSNTSSILKDTFVNLSSSNLIKKKSNKKSNKKVSFNKERKQRLIYLNEHGEDEPVDSIGSLNDNTQTWYKPPEIVF